MTHDFMFFFLNISEFKKQLIIKQHDMTLYRYLRLSERNMLMVDINGFFFFVFFCFGIQTIVFNGF